jgi:hypothetical protein
MSTRLVLALALLCACGGKARHAGAVADAGALAAAQPVAHAADAALAPELDAAPVKKEDVLEGAAAETAIAEAGLAADAGAEAAPTGLRSDGVGAFKLGMARAEVVKLVAPGALVRQPTAPNAPREDDAYVAGPAGAWLRVHVYAGRVTELDVLARDPRALTDEGIGVGSTFDAAVLAHGEARAVLDKAGRVRGWVLADLPGVLWQAAPGTSPRAPLDAGDDDRDAGDDATRGPAPPAGAVVWRIAVLGAEELAQPD